MPDRSRAFTGLAVVGAAASVALPASASAPAAESTIGFHNLASSNVPGEVGVAIYEPPGYDPMRAEACYASLRPRPGAPTRRLMK